MTILKAWTVYYLEKEAVPIESYPKNVQKIPGGKDAKMAHPVRFLLHTPSNLSSITKTHIKVDRETQTPAYTQFLKNKDKRCIRMITSCADKGNNFSCKGLYGNSFRLAEDTAVSLT